MGIGFAGIFIPLLPTTPFLLIALFLFVRSSPAASQWLTGHRLLGSYVSAYTTGAGLPTRIRLRVVVSMWLVMAVSMVFFTDLPWVRVMLAAIGMGVTIHVMTFRRCGR